MKISREEIHQVARLARLELTGQEAERMTGQLDTILRYVDKLNEVDTTGVAATTHTQNVVNVFREDVMLSSLEKENALANAPESSNDSFIVPRVI